jgi:hypothetical protein
MKRKLSVVAVAMAFACGFGGAASADTSSVFQDGADNVANVSQNNTSNASASVSQIGNHNEATVTQQTNLNNSASVSSVGDNNRATVLQDNSVWALATVSQNGTSNTATVNQVPNGSGSYSNGNGQTIGAGGAPVSCESDPNDACDTCFKNSCCNEIEACDDGCKAKYVEYLDCIAPDGVPTGYNKNYCMASVGATGAAAALIDCSATNCYTASACGAPNKDTWNDFAADFMERYCGTDTLCCTAHFPSPSVGKIRRKGNGFSCEAM